ncbi:GGDEF domain-containing protein [Solimicrobium silvestre]|uniref:diguanylate cyclase n=1 Tax=Solimicrobium silvestre TaxID=2099400 RepID=A0A2S9GXM0_9BURK|nr:GGDEF domain-containing protein [Solimicrobium silvestre]PRC92464.1 GGDEF: diguanylate cyclase (GGDEF) domain [Solimicrobium silvestre]
MFVNLDVRTIYLVLAVLSITQALLMFYVRQVHNNSSYVAEWARGNALVALGLCLVVVSEIVAPALLSTLSYLLIIWGTMHIAFGVALVSGKRPMRRLFQIICGIFYLAYLLAYVVGMQGVGGIVLFTIAASIFYGYSIYCCYTAQRDELRASLLLVAVMSGAYLISVYIHLLGASPADLSNPLQNSMWHSGALIVNMVLSFAQTFMLLVITSHRLQMELKQQATRDPLTNAFNRRALAKMAERDIARSNRRGTLISVLMIDADHFKNINDTFGHTIGDAVLVAMANKIQAGLRIEDILARYGGEEFLVMLPDTSLKHACEVAERIRAAIADMALPELPRQFSVSIGVAERQGVQQSFEELVAKADQALYQAKNNGRNQVFAGKPISAAVPEYSDEEGVALA